MLAPITLKIGQCRMWNGHPGQYMAFMDPPKGLAQSKTEP
jgi:hypothetical protein